MNIMYLTDVGFDSSNGSNHLIASMLSAFLDSGHSVYLVQSHTTGEYEDIPSELKGKENFFSDTIVRPVVAKSNFVKRYISAIHYEFLAKRRWKKKIKNIDVVLLQSHYTAVFTAMLLNKYKKKIVFNIFDIFPGEAYTNKNIKSKFVYDFFRWIQKYLYKHCSKFFTLTTDTKKTLISLGVNENKIAVIPNWFNDKAIHEVNPAENSFMKEYNMSEDTIYVQYAGSLGVSYDFDLIIDVAEHLSYRSDIVIQIVGDGLNLDRMKLLVSQEHLQNVQFIPWQPIERLSEVYSACTMQIIPLRKDVIKNSYPSKILPLMACGRVPVISVEEDSDFYSLVNGEGFGLATPSGNIDQLINSIVRIADCKDLRSAMQQNAIRYVYEHYTAKENTQKMINEFEKLQIEEK